MVDIIADFNLMYNGEDSSSTKALLELLWKKVKAGEIPYPTIMFIVKEDPKKEYKGLVKIALYKFRGVCNIRQVAYSSNLLSVGKFPSTHRYDYFKNSEMSCRIGIRNFEIVKSRSVHEQVFLRQCAEKHSESRSQEKDTIIVKSGFPGVMLHYKAYSVEDAKEIMISGIFPEWAYFEYHFEEIGPTF